MSAGQLCKVRWKFETILQEKLILVGQCRLDAEDSSFSYFLAGVNFNHTPRVERLGAGNLHMV